MGGGYDLKTKSPNNRFERGAPTASFGACWGDPKARR